MRPSDLPLSWKIAMVVAFVAIMAGLWWFARNVFYVWLPDGVAAALGFVLMAFAAGFLLGQRSMALQVKKRWGQDPRDGG